MSNSKSKTLIANWVEERQCAHLEEGNKTEDGTLSTKLHQTGHKGILSPSPSSTMDCTTIVQSSYAPPSSIATNVRSIGKRQEQLMTQLYDMVRTQVHDEFHPPPPPPEYLSTTKNDFGKEFSPTKLPLTTSHDVYNEAQTTYWSDNMQTVTGVTQAKNNQAPFHKNTAFSTPIEEYLDQAKPHNIN